MFNALFKDKNDCSVFRGNLQRLLYETRPLLPAMGKYSKNFGKKAESAVIRRIEDKDEKTIAGWVKKAENRYLGEQEHVNKDTIQRWSQEAYIASVLEMNGELLVFFTLAPYEKEQGYWELGRMVVATAWRKRGVGIFMLKYIVMRISLARRASEVMPQILVRVDEKNIIGQKLMDKIIRAKLPRGCRNFIEYTPPEAEKQGCFWYKLT